MGTPTLRQIKLLAYHSMIFRDRFDRLRCDQGVKITAADAIYSVASRAKLAGGSLLPRGVNERVVVVSDRLQIVDETGRRHHITIAMAGNGRWVVATSLRATERAVVLEDLTATVETVSRWVAGRELQVGGQKIDLIEFLLDSIVHLLQRSTEIKMSELEGEKVALTYLTALRSVGVTPS